MHPLRVALYSHDTVGLGHTRRNLTIAAALSRRDADLLMITGNPEATRLPLPRRTDVITMPTIGKDAAGDYRSRVLSLSYPDMINVRRALLSSVLGEFRPDLLIVDKVPRGAGGELEPALRQVARDGGRAVLGLREVLDDPASTAAQWRADRTTQAIDEFYAAVWVYGDPRVYDPRTEYRLPGSVADKLEFTGYLSRGRTSGLTGGRGSVGQLDPARPYVACLVGGGQDGDALALAFAEAAFPQDHLGVVVCGPYLAAERRARLRQLAGRRSDLVLLDVVPGADAVIDRAAAVVSMAGYNTVCEILATATPALLVPRTRPRAEQLIRAERFAGRGLVDLLPPDRLSPGRLADWLASAVAGSAQATLRSSTSVRLDGLARIPHLADALLGVTEDAA
ncbi:glycosyltransferase family protein [Microlunatus parietis]|uniref:Putative glycosyltransferase n=1 Tax=Microlunatus parietis TaxID=682979 RepID=A0A7Y9IER4_9ACTN|nr:glycosyltransferase [Microlunatus parietis]NYE75489.1 putative glycosyltransferase [Microlunatus parietis]